MTPCDSYGREKMKPIISNITDNIKIYRDSSKSRHRNYSQKRDEGIQTDPEVFFKYIFEFLGEIGRLIDSGEMCVEDIIKQGETGDSASTPKSTRLDSNNSSDPLVKMQAKVINKKIDD